MADKFDGNKMDKHHIDEMGIWNQPKGKLFKIGKLFFLYREKYMFWFRIFGYGISAKSLKKKWFILFSERHGYRKTYKAFGWKFEMLKPFKKLN